MRAGFYWWPLVLGLAGCGEGAGPTDYMSIAGGGLTFNYRYSQMTMVVVGKQLRPLPEGGKVVAYFEVPGQNQKQEVSRDVVAGKLVYKLESKYLTGIKKDQKISATLVVVDKDGKEVDRDVLTRTSDVDQSTLPTKPLVDPSSPNYAPQLENL